MMLTDSPRVKRAALWTAIFAMPVAAVQLAGWITGAGAAPAQATASVAQNPALDAQNTLINLSIGFRQPRGNDAERGAVERIEQLRSEPFGPTPMLHATRQQQTGTAPAEPDEIATPLPEVDPIPNINLQAIMSGSDTTAAHALIDHHLHTIGQTIGDTGWLITEINAESRRIVIEHRVTARSATLTLDAP